MGPQQQNDLKIAKFFRIALPAVTSRDYHATSDATESYNCVAWAIGETFRWYQPKLADFPPFNLYYWHNNYSDSCDALEYAEFFATHGFEFCKNGDPESGHVKIAVFADEDDEFTHVARQLENGFWTSKFGWHEDAEHESLRPFENQGYGRVVFYMKKKA